MPELTIAEWAEKQGISRQAAYKRIKSGKVKLNSAGKIDSAEAERDWERNKDAHQQSRGAPKAKAKSTPPEEEDDSRSFAAAQRAREWLKVGKEQFLLQKLQGSVLPKEDVRRAWATIVTSIRSRLLLLPDKVAPRVAVVSDVLEVRALIDAEVREILTALSEEDLNSE